MADIALPNGFEILQWSAVGVWTFNISSADVNCAICNQKTTFKCMECISKDAEIDCTVARGKCNHGFHLHCINKWLNTGRQKCPICYIPWNYQKENLNDTIPKSYKPY